MGTRSIESSRSIRESSPPRPAGRSAPPVLLALTAPACPDDGTCTGRLTVQLSYAGTDRYHYCLVCDENPQHHFRSDLLFVKTRGSDHRR